MVVGLVSEPVGACCGAVGEGEARAQRVEGGGSNGRSVGKSGEEEVDTRRDSAESRWERSRVGRDTSNNATASHACSLDRC